MHQFHVAPQHSAPSLSLALQDGGSLGAFAWGVIDAILEADIGVNAVSGASAGAINAVVLAQGLLDGGAQGARTKLERFWRRVSNASPLSGIPASGAAFAAMQTSLPTLSPAQVNPLRIDPLREILGDEIDFPRLRKDLAVQLLVSATRVRDGRARIFRNDELTLEVVLASACLPMLNHSAEIDGDWYWDGGYSANPPLRELVWATPDHDILIVDLTAPAPAKPPRLPREI
jgi:NTE family protein